MCIRDSLGTDAGNRHRTDVLALGGRHVLQPVGLVGVDDDLSATVTDRPRQGNDLDHVGATPKDAGGSDHYRWTLQSSLTAGRRTQIEVDDITRRQHRATSSRRQSAGSRDRVPSSPDGAPEVHAQPFDLSLIHI